MRPAPRIALLAVLTAMFVLPAAAPARADVELTVDPGGIAFGLVAAGTTEYDDVEITNTGTEPVPLGAIAYAGDPEFFGALDECSTVTLGVGESCQLAFGFAPPSSSSKHYSGVVTLAGSAETGPIDIELDGESFIPGFLTFPPRTDHEAPTVDFGWVTPGTTSATRTVKVQAAGGLVYINGLQADYGTLGAFRVGGNCVGAVLAPGASCDLALTFAPTAAKSYSTTMRLLTGATGASHPIRLTGGGSQPPRVDPRPKARADMAKLIGAIPRLVRGGPKRVLSLPAFSSANGNSLKLRLTGRIRGRSVVLAEGTAYIRRGGLPTKLKFRLNRVGRKYLRAKRAKVRVALTYSWYAEVRTTVTKTVTVRR